MMISKRTPHEPPEWSEAVKPTRGAMKFKLGAMGCVARW